MQKLISYFSLAGLVAFSAFASAQTSWQVEAEKYIKTLQRPVDIYTWEPRASWSSKPGEIVQSNDPRAYALLTNYANSFADPNEKLHYEGPNGVYFATDPFVSREWGSNQSQRFSGGREWSVIRVTLPAGSRFLDGRMDTSFGSAMQQFVRGKGCGANTPRELLNVRARSDRRECWNAYTEIIRVLNVQALAKFFYALAPEYCTNHNSFITDLIVVDPKAMTNFAVFTAEIPNPDAAVEERIFIRDFWMLAKKVVEKRCAGTPPAANWPDRFNSPACNFYVSSPYQYELPWSLPESDLSSPLLKQKIEEKIFGCGNYREDRP